jgi:predicted RNA-binding protein YlxR (DUF448 family)
VPLRTCVACRRKREKAELLRWIVNEDGTAAPDPAAVHPGRGAYVCRDEACLDRLLRRGAKVGFAPGPAEAAFRLAIRPNVVQNVPGESA